MKYDHIEEGVFLQRPNRFIALVELGGRVETVHVKNTGRCAELLLPRSRVWLSKAKEGRSRRTAYDLVAVEKLTRGGAMLVNIDSQAPNTVAWEYLSRTLPEGTSLRREVRYKASRFDLSAKEGDKVTYIEVKGVTLERDAGAYFPDAPTERGVKHLLELADAASCGYGAELLFVVQMKGVSFVSPNYHTHPEFAAALRYAAQCGVNIRAVDCDVTPDSITADALLPVLIR